MLVFASTDTVRVTGLALPGGWPSIVTVVVPRAIIVPMRPMGVALSISSGGNGCPLEAREWFASRVFFRTSQALTQATTIRRLSTTIKMRSLLFFIIEDVKI
jgi:hypothetical protein